MDQADVVRRGTLDVNRDREPAAIGDRMIFEPFPRFALPTPAPPCFAQNPLLVGEVTE